MLNHRLPLVLLIAGCAEPSSLQPIDGRDDLVMQSFHTEIRNGLSNELRFEATDDLASMLVEVRGDRGRYYLTKFVTPNGTQTGADLIEGAQYTTRFAREVPGLVDWLYPNTPTLSMEGGEHKLLLRGESPGGGPISEDVEVRIYAKKQQDFDTCGVHLDFLVDENAIDANDIDIALDRGVEWVNNLYAPHGIRIIDYQITSITLPNPDFDPDSSSVTRQVDEVLEQARASGKVRSDSIRVIAVRRIGGQEPSGSSMGLPGPFDEDRPNAAVLVSTDSYTDAQGYLNVEGLASTIAHEMGHFLGLYHTSEPDRSRHDPLPDTPECTGACSPEFQRNIMSSGGGSIRTDVSEGQAFVIKHHPLCIPTKFEDLPVTTCDLECDSPETCSIVAGAQACRPACDPSDEPSTCAAGTCRADDVGTFVCR